MKTLIAIFLFTASIAQAAQYECVIPNSELPAELQSGQDINISFQLDEDQSTEPFLVFFGDSFDRCKYLSTTAIECYDAEGMPYTIEKISETEARVSVGKGIYLDRVKANCEHSL